MPNLWYAYDISACRVTTRHACAHLVPVLYYIKSRLVTVTVTNLLLTTCTIPVGNGRLGFGERATPKRPCVVYVQRRIRELVSGSAV